MENETQGYFTINFQPLPSPAAKTFNHHLIAKEVRGEGNTNRT